MRTERVTVLMTPAEKAVLSARAAMLGVSSGAVLRAGLDDREDVTLEQERELAMLAAELKLAVPKMEAALERSCQVLEDLHRENEDFFRARGVC